MRCVFNNREIHILVKPPHELTVQQMWETAAATSNETANVGIDIKPGSPKLRKTALTVPRIIESQPVPSGYGLNTKQYRGDLHAVSVDGHEIDREYWSIVTNQRTPTYHTVMVS